MGNTGEDVWKENLERNLVYLTSHLKVNHTLFAHLKQDKVIKDWDEQEIMAYREDNARVNAFITCLKKRPAYDYHRFLRALVETNQEHIVERLTGSILNPDSPSEGRIHVIYAMRGTTEMRALEDGTQHEEMTSAIVCSQFQGDCQNSLETRKAEDEDMVAVIGGKACKQRSVEVWKTETLSLPSIGELELRITELLDASCCENWKSNCKTSACYIDKKIYALQRDSPFRLLKYDFEGRNWSISINEGDRYISDGFIFLAEGHLYFYGAHANYKAMICLELKENWMHLIGTRRTLINDFAVVSSRDGFYVIGGKSGDSVLASVDRFSVSSNIWQPMEEMSRCRRLHAAVCLGNKIYVCGGKDHDGETLSTCEVYSISGNKWGSIGSMSTPRHSFSLVAGRGKLLAIGGLGAGSSNVLSTIDVYTPGENSWSLAGTSLKEKRYEHASVAFPEII